MNQEYHALLARANRERDEYVARQLQSLATAFKRFFNRKDAQDQAA